MPRKVRGRARGPRGARKSNTRGGNLGLREDDEMDLDSGGTLQLGGVTLQVSNDGHVRGIRSAHVAGQRRRSQRRRAMKLRERASDEGDDEDALQDYIDNTAESSGGPQKAEQELAVMTQIAAYQLDQTFDTYGHTLPGDESSSWEADSEDSTSEYGSDVSLDDILSGFESKLDLVDRFPVSLRSNLLRSAAGGSTTSSSSYPAGLRRQRAGAGGVARGGARRATVSLADKATLKRQKMRAKQAARAGARGLDVASVNQQLHDFVVNRGDIQGLMAVGKYSASIIQKMAALYGLKSSQQGTGKRKYVMVSATQRTALPEGEAHARLMGLMQWHQNALAAMGPGTKPPRTRRLPKRGRQGNEGEPNLPRFNTPVTFVASGVLDPNTVQHSVFPSQLADPTQSPAFPPPPSFSPASAGPSGREPSIGFAAQPSGPTPLPAFPPPPSFPPASAGPSGREPSLGFAAPQPRCAVPGFGGACAGFLGQSPGGFAYADGSSSSQPSPLGLGLLQCSPGFGAERSMSDATMSGLDVGHGLGWGTGGLGSRSSADASGSLLQQGLDDHMLLGEDLLQAGSGLGVQLHAEAACEAADIGMGDEPTPSDDDACDAAHGTPLPLMTAAKERAARKKREKDARREARARDSSGVFIPPSDGPISVETLVETSLEYGGFERHTTGFGSRMLAKWGFEGQGSGLGREGRGRAEPLSVRMRPKKLGLGAGAGAGY